MHRQPLDYEKPIQKPPDARPIFRVLAGLLGIGAACSVPMFLYFGWGKWQFMLIAIPEFLFACAALKLAITGRLQIGEQADA